MLIRFDYLHIMLQALKKKLFMLYEPYHFVIIPALFVCLFVCLFAYLLACLLVSYYFLCLFCILLLSVMNLGSRATQDDDRDSLGDKQVCPKPYQAKFSIL